MDDQMVKMDLFRYYTLLKDIARNARLGLEKSPKEQRFILEEIAKMADTQVEAHERIYK